MELVRVVMEDIFCLDLLAYWGLLLQVHQEVVRLRMLDHHRMQDLSQIILFLRVQTFNFMCTLMEEYLEPSISLITLIQPPIVLLSQVQPLKQQQHNIFIPQGLLILDYKLLISLYSHLFYTFKFTKKGANMNLIIC